MSSDLRGRCQGRLRYKITYGERDALQGAPCRRSRSGRLAMLAAKCGEPRPFDRRFVERCRIVGGWASDQGCPCSEKRSEPRRTITQNFLPRASLPAIRADVNGEAAGALFLLFLSTFGYFLSRLLRN